MSDDLKRTLRESYNRKVDERDSRTAPTYELQERDAFLSLLCAEQKRSVLDLGAATHKTLCAIPELSERRTSATSTSMPSTTGETSRSKQARGCDPPPVHIREGFIECAPSRQETDNALAL